MDISTVVGASVWGYWLLLLRNEFSGIVEYCYSFFCSTMLILYRAIYKWTKNLISPLRFYKRRAFFWWITWCIRNIEWKKQRTVWLGFSC